MKNIFITVAFAACFLPLFSNGQCCPYIDGVVVYPASPTPTDSITIEFTVTTPNLGAYLGETHYIDNDTVVINACYYVGMATALQTFVETTTIPPLPSGNYFIRLHAMQSADMTQCIPGQFNDSVFSFTVAGGVPPICDSVFLAVDTFHIWQGVDTAITATVTFTGMSDVSYSMVSFVFNDSTYIDINDFAVTNGVAGPFTFTWDYELIYNQPSIPFWTAVPAEFWIFHDGVSGPIIDCKLPVVFMINEEVSTNNKPIIQVSIYPNPTENDLVVTGLTPSDDIALTDMASRIRLIHKADGNQMQLNTGELPKGVYILRVTNSKGVWTDRIIKL